MHPKRKQRLTIAVLVVVLSSAAVGLVSYALRGNINLFYPPADIVAGKAPVDRAIRVGGMVVEGSILRSEQDLTTVFEVTDYAGTVTVSYTGILPDLFAEERALLRRACCYRTGAFARPRCWQNTTKTTCRRKSLKRYRAPSPQTRRTGRGG